MFEVVPFDVPLIKRGELPEETLLGTLPNRHKSKDMDKDGFLLEIQRVAFEVERIIEKYGVRDEVLSLMVTGLVEDEDEDGDRRLRAIYSYNLETEEEMLSLLNFVEETFIPSNRDDDGPDIDDLLDGLGISLN